jgi:vacuolar-type H+-ATPase subunit D/Vma8
MPVAVDPHIPMKNDPQEHYTADLMQKLDALFEQYLNTLDQYQKTREQLSSQLSSGFMSLAQANFSNKGRQYGQDYYDERMQAQRVLSIASDKDVLNVKCERVKDEISEDANGEETTQKLKFASKDPLRWFGVLVPPRLRSAQASFASVVEGPVPRLIILQHELRNLEIEIGRTRKMIKKLAKV